ncbi:MAG: ATP-binding protein [Gammaproteobacteria bacterium]|nr:ATP-binding protein [Gammaproteobacteria bacterium]
MKKLFSKKTESEQQNTDKSLKKAPLSFSWFGFLIAAACLAYFYIIADPQRMVELDLNDSLAAPQSQISVLFVFLLAIILEAIRFQRQKRIFDSLVDKYERRLTELLAGKNTLQNKVHKYSDHADKLKFFISDRLLEYIEYDEKFLHFRHIASEVRHNGVISYDKVNTALKKAIKERPDQDVAEYESALRSMGYLWDLLDLSTTDNIAMYIANKIYASEEHYYRQLLDDDKESPYSPTYSTRLAVIHSLDPFVRNRDNTLPAEGKKSETYNYHDAYFWLCLKNAGELLGNENYLVLMLENLINNALYYHNNKRYGHKYSRIAVKLSKNDKYARISVYNSGPNIDTELQEEIFQLGFSTKRTKGHHGKGLGLYFVNEIVKGYEGEIKIRNISNKTETYVVRIELGNGETLNQIIEVKLDEDQKPYCFVKGENAEEKEIQYRLDEKIRSIEISVQSSQKTFVANRVGKEGKTVLLDPQHPDIPRWSIEIQHLKSSEKVIFKPLDVTGVQFNILLPTAESRLDAEYHELDDATIDELENPNIEFIDTDPYR